MRNFVGVLLSVLMLACVLQAGVFAEPVMAGNVEIAQEQIDFSLSGAEDGALVTAEPSNGTCGVNLNWTLDENGLFTVSGNGDMINYASYNEVPWYSMRSSIKSINICDGVTSIGDWAFYTCQSVTEIKLPDSLKCIGQWAFYMCDGVTRIEIPEKVESIGEYAFWYCHNLVLVENSSSLEFTLGTSHNGHVCDNAYKLINKDGSIAYRSGYTEDENGFIFSSHREMKAYVGDKETVTLPLNYNGQRYMINYIRGVKKVIIPDGMTRIDNSAFNGCATLLEMVIPASVTEIGDSSLGSCRNLVKISVDEGNENYSSDSNGVLFNKDKTVILQYPSGSPAPLYTIPNSVECISRAAFKDSRLLTEAVIPESVTSIEGSAFWGCSSLVKVKIPDSVVSLEESAFGGCTALEELEITKNITTIREHTFSECTSLSKVKIPDSITTIGDYAFNVCSSLCEIELPDSVEYIGFSAFGNTAYYDDEDNWKDGFLYIGNHLIAADRDVSGSVEIKAGTICIAGEAFERNSSLTEIKLPDSVVSIGSWAFSDCSALENVVFGKGLKTIGEYAFDYCTSLTQIKIPDSVTSLGWAFRGCEKLENVVLGKGLTAIAERTFNDCSALETITICNKVTQIGIGAFEGCTSLATVYFRGTEEQWNCIDIGIHDNECLENAQIIFLGEQTVAMGDATGDEKVNIQDVILLAQYCAGWDSAKEKAVEEALDTNGDGKINVQDVILLAQYCANWGVTLG